MDIFAFFNFHNGTFDQNDYNAFPKVLAWQKKLLENEHIKEVFDEYEERRAPIKKKFKQF